MCVVTFFTSECNSHGSGRCDTKNASWSISLDKMFSLCTRRIANWKHGMKSTIRVDLSYMSADGCAETSNEAFLTSVYSCQLNRSRVASTLGTGVYYTSGIWMWCDDLDVYKPACIQPGLVSCNRSLLFDSASDLVIWIHYNPDTIHSPGTSRLLPVCLFWPKRRLSHTEKHLF